MSGPPAAGSPLDKGVALFNARRFREARRVLEAAARGAAPASPERFFLAHCLRELGERAGAERLLRAALRSDPASSSARLDLARLLREAGRPAAAVRVLSAGGELPELLRDHGAALQELALSHKDAGRPLAARRAWERLRRLDPSNPEARRELAPPDREPVAVPGPAGARRGLEDPGSSLMRRLRGLLERGRLSRAMALWASRGPAAPGARRAVLAALVARLAGRREEEGRERAARTAWERVVELAPGETQAWSRLQAILVYRLNRRRDPDGVRAVRRLLAGLDRLPRPLSAAQRGLRFATLIPLGRYREAFEEGERLLDQGPKVINFRQLARPWGRYPAGFERRLIPVLRRLDEDAGNRPWSSYYLGMMSRELARFEPVFTRSRRRYGWMYGRIGLAFLEKGSYERALELFGAAVAHRPADWMFHAWRAETFLCLKERKAAWAEMDLAERRAPAEERSQVLAWRGELKLWLGDYREAHRLLDEALRLGGQGAAVYAFGWRGAAKVGLGRPLEALEDLEAALRLQPRDLEVLLWRGEANRLLGRHAEALKDLGRRPMSSWAYFNRGLLRAELGDLAGMRRDFAWIPPARAAYLRKSLGLGDGPLDDQDKLLLLRRGLELARGYRRDELYGDAIWMGA